MTSLVLIFYSYFKEESVPDDLVASINGDPHVLIKNGDAVDPSQYFCFDIVAVPDQEHVTILDDSSKFSAHAPAGLKIKLVKLTITFKTF